MTQPFSTVVAAAEGLVAAEMAAEVVVAAEVAAEVVAEDAAAVVVLGMVLQGEEAAMKRSSTTCTR